MIKKCINSGLPEPFSVRTASRELEELYKKGVIEKKIIRRVGKGKDTYYILVTE